MLWPWRAFSVPSSRELPAADPVLRWGVVQGLGVEPAEESKAYIRFLVPRSAERVLPEFFAALQARRGELGVTDVQLSLSTLEEVFLAIARQAELETAQAEGRYDKITLADGTALQVQRSSALLGW